MEEIPSAEKWLNNDELIFDLLPFERYDSLQFKCNLCESVRTAEEITGHASFHGKGSYKVNLFPFLGEEKEKGGSTVSTPNGETSTYNDVTAIRVQMLKHRINTLITSYSSAETDICQKELEIAGLKAVIGASEEAVRKTQEELAAIEQSAQIDLGG